MCRNWGKWGHMAKWTKQMTKSKIEDDGMGQKSKDNQAGASDWHVRHGASELSAIGGSSGDDQWIKCKYDTP